MVCQQDFKADAPTPLDEAFCEVRFFKPLLFEIIFFCQKLDYFIHACQLKALKSWSFQDRRNHDMTDEKINYTTGTFFFAFVLR